MPDSQKAHNRHNWRALVTIVRRAQHDDDREAVSNVSCGTPSAETALVYREEVRRAVKALDRFPPNVKTAFLLNRYRISRFFFYPPLVFLALAVIYTSIIGTFVVPV